MLYLLLLIIKDTKEQPDELRSEKILSAGASVAAESVLACVKSGHHMFANLEAFQTSLFRAFYGSFIM